MHERWGLGLDFLLISHENKLSPTLSSTVCLAVTARPRSPYVHINLLSLAHSLLNLTHTHTHPFTRTLQQHSSATFTSVLHAVQVFASLSKNTSEMKYLSLAAFALAASVVKAQSIPTCALNCATPVCTAGVADLACFCVPTNLESIGACVATACTATADIAAATGLSSLICRMSPPPSPLFHPSLIFFSLNSDMR